MLPLFYMPTLDQNKELVTFISKYIVILPKAMDYVTHFSVGIAYPR